MDENSLNKLYAKTSKLKVLYVEDNEIVRESTLAILEEFFDNIEVAADGAEGLEKYKVQVDTFEIVISDIEMPKMNGVEMSKAIFEINPLENILVITAYNDSEQLQELMNIGITHFIHKPIEINELISEFHKIVLDIETRKEKEKEWSEIKSLNHELDSSNVYVISSRTDLNGIITHASKAFQKISGYKKEELIDKPHNIVRHPDMPVSVFQDMWETIKNGKIWKGEVINLHKDGSLYWLNANVAPYYNENGTHIGYSSIRTDITDRKEIEKLHSEVNNLLDNAGEGFLSFDENMKINSSFSKECINIFGFKEISNKNIADILFSNDLNKRELFLDGIKRTIETDEEMIKELFLSLLPSEHIINKRDISIEYKALENNTFMLILTDITKIKLLEKKVKEQNQIQKMIVAVASNKNDFIDLKFDFENFILNSNSYLTEMLRELHTFKGIFAQKEMLNITNAIHELEDKINNDSEKNKNLELAERYGLQNIFNKDLKIIASILGEEYINNTPKLNIDREDLYNLESKILDLLEIQVLQSEGVGEKIKDILHDFEVIRYEKVYDMLSIYPTAVKQLAEKLQKEVYPLEIVGDKNLAISSKYKPFIKSLIHLFANCIDHGIEDMQTRTENAKNEVGKIRCKFFKSENTLKIIISDDGSGINAEQLIEIAKSKGIAIEDDPMKLIFADGLSSKEHATTTSGRGIGMSAIKYEIAKLNGKIDIKNNIGMGVEFIFTLAI